MPDISTRARNLYHRLLAGAWYSAFSDYTPKAMKELQDVGLVKIAGRVKVVEACFVPAGFVPHKPEKFNG